MKIRMPLLLILFAIAILIPQGASAQSCAIDYEAIIRFSTPPIGAYNVREALHGERFHNTRFAHGIVDGERNTVIAGRTVPMVEGAPRLLLAQFDRRGRIAWENILEIDGFSGVADLVALDEGFLALVNVRDQDRRQKIWLGFFDANGEKTSEKLISDPKGHVYARDILVLNETLKLAVTFEDMTQSIKPYSRIYTLDLNGRVKGERSYFVGVKNIFHALAVKGENHLLVAGTLDDDTSRQAGWILELDESGIVVWQQPFPRGRAAAFHAVTSYINDMIVVAGQASPFGEGEIAGWLMAYDLLRRDIVWQRYFTGDEVFRAHEVLVNQDSLVSTLVNIDPPEDDDSERETAAMDSVPNTDYVRLLTFNRRGFLLQDNAYYSGKAADAQDMVQGPSGERIMFGQALVPDMPDNPVPEDNQPDSSTGEPAEVRSDYKGWLLVAAPADEYNDPCE